METRADRNLEATVKVNCWNAMAGEGGPPKSLMAQAAVTGCLSPGRSSQCSHLEKKGKTVSQKLATAMDKRKNSCPEGKLLRHPRL